MDLKLAAILICMATAIHAQSVTLTITGKVEERGGEELAGVLLRLVDTQGQPLAEHRSMADGRFEFPAILDRNRYLLEIAKTGFITKRVEFVAEDAGCDDKMNEDFKLKLTVELFKPEKNCTYAQYDEPIGTVSFSPRGCNKPVFEAKSPKPDCDPSAGGLAGEGNRKIRIVLSARSDDGSKIQSVNIFVKEENGTLIDKHGSVTSFPFAFDGPVGMRNFLLSIESDGCAPRSILFVALGENCDPKQSRDREIKIDAELVRKRMGCDYSAYNTALCKVEFSPIGCMTPKIRCEKNPVAVCQNDSARTKPSLPKKTPATAYAASTVQIEVADIRATEEEGTNFIVYVTDIMVSEEKSKRFRKIVYTWGAVYYQIDGRFTSEGSFRQELGKYKKR